MPLIAVMFVAVWVAVMASLALWLRSRRKGTRVARTLQLVAVLLTLVVAAVVVGPAWQDSGSFALVLVGIPLACALITFLAPRTRHAILLAWIAAVTMLLWSLVIGLGLGVNFQPPAILLIASATSATLEARRPPGVATPSGSD